jgi:UDP-glucose 4-epimerase
MKILVTGGAGFIGSHLVDELVKRNHRVIIIDNLSTGKKENINPKAKFYQIDICSPKIAHIFKKEKPEIIYHCAAQINLRSSLKDPIFDAKTNIIGSLNILKETLSFKKIKRFIFSSTGGGIYGETRKIPTKENEPAEPTTPYGLNKLIFEKYLEIYSRFYSLSYVILRYANVYGPRQNTKAEAGVIAIFIEKLLREEIPTINGDGNQTRDFIYVDDVVRANLLFLENKIYSLVKRNKEVPIFNVGTGIETSIIKLFKKICQLLGKKVKPKYGPFILGDLKRSALDCSKIKKFGWKPIIDLESGLNKTIEWFKNKYQNFS